MWMCSAVCGKIEKEIYQRTQETQIEQQLPINTTGIVPVPRGSRGPRSLYIKRHDDSFGFTLRHFIVYPPDSLTEHCDGRHAAVGALLAPMDTIFVKHVKDRSPAKQAGLQRGDRLIAVNGVPVKDKSYSEVVQLIVNSPDYLHILVVPKEEDVLQRFFAETAYNPASNQPTYSDIPNDRVSAQQFLTHHLGKDATGLQVDAISWRSLQQPYAQTHFTGLQRVAYDRGQRSADNLYSSDTRQQRPSNNYQQEIYAEICPNEYGPRTKSRAVPQVPLYRKMGRRASEGNTLSDRERYRPPDYPSLNSGALEEYNMKAAYKSSYDTGADMSSLSAGNCRLSSDVGRRESTSSMSSTADGSKESLAFFGSTSTLTGHETDDSAIMTRVRRSVQQKEEFLKMPVSTEEQAVRKEFYGRPKKLERQVWPPTEKEVLRNTKPAHQNVMRVKNDIESERDLVSQNQNGQQFVLSGGDYSLPLQKGATSPRERANAGMARVHEAETAPKGYDSLESANGPFVEESTCSDDRKMYPPGLQIVQKRAKDFESGRPLPEDDPSLGNKMNFSRSELARLSSKKLVPTVCARAQEYETRTGFEPRRDTSSTSTNTTSTTASAQKRIQRDSRSLDSSDVSSNETSKIQVRSNSAESWVGALDNDRNKETFKRISRQDATLPVRTKSNESTTFNEVSKTGDLSPLIPVPVERIHLPPAVSVTPLTSPTPVRPNQLDLEGPIRPARHIKPSRSIALNTEDKPVVVKRRPKNTNLSEDDRAMRRESYLKATEGGRMHIDMQLSDGGDVSPQVLRSGSISSNSSGSIDRDKVCISPTLEKRYSIIREGTLHCKILEIDGKRSTDRSWKQVFIVLKGPKLYLYKDRHHLSPVSTSDSVDQYLSSGVDMRTSVVRVAEDYTKRKNVLRVSAVKPCRSEFLLQTESTDELADWVKVFSEQVAASTDAELEPNNSKQQAVPQLVPASTTIQVQGSHLSPQWNKPKVTSSRNRSPTGQSPVSKSRKPSQVIDPCTSPKSKTWKGRMVKQFRKFNQGGNSLNSPTAPEGSTFGIPLEDCLPSHANVYLPKFVEYCTDIIDEKGLHTIGIYRVPGNNASITGLTEEINKIYDDLPSDDPRWHDLHVVSSLLKSYFRKMPDSLVTNHLYPYFIKADKIEDPKARMEELRRLVNCLPKHNYHTLKHIIGHLKRVADNSHMNKMEAKNLAIVFGPTIVRPEAENMENMVNHMTNQCKIVESLLTHADWFFPDNYSEDNIPVPVPAEVVEDFDSPQNQALLLHNISKYEAFKDTKEKNGALFTSIISAAQRKVKRKPHKGSNSLHDSKDEATSPTNLKIFPSQSFSSSDLKESSCVDGKVNEEIPTTVMEMEQNKQQTEKVPWFNYTTDKEDFLRRIENFKQETAAMLQLPRKTEISVNNIDTKAMSQFSSSACNVNQNHRLSTKPADLQLLTKTHSACNVFERHMGSNARNSLTTVESGPYSLQYDNSYRKETHSSVSDSGHKNNNGVNGRGYRDGSEKRAGRSNLRRGSSAENVNGSGIDTSSGNMKKVKFETESDSQRTGSLDSLNKLQTDDESLLSTMTKLIDEKLKEEHKQSTSLAVVTAPVIEDSLEKRKKSIVDKENILQASDLYRNPSLHKSQFDNNNSYKKEEKDSKEKEVDTMAAESIPDNERHISKPFNANNKLNQNASGSKLRRSESLNKPERTVSPMNKLKRSESLNKGEKLKRSDSLSKTEKTENNNNKRRELSLSNKRLKDSTKNKRKNGMPDRSIKRRHTVGGTKDPDKITWLLDNKNQEAVQQDSENVKEKNLRTSSPDLSSTRRDRFFFEINLIGPENMVVALRQHLIGSSARPQSFPESSVFKVPLESHV